MDAGRRRSRLGADVAAPLQFELVLEQFGLRRVADGDEDAVDLHRGLFAGLGVDQFRGRHAQRIFHALDRGELVIPEHVDLRILEQALLQDFLGAQLVAAMHECHLLCQIGEIQGFLDGRVAAADHDDVLAAIEEPVAGGASGHAEALELLFRRQTEPACLRAGGDDERVRQIFVAAVALEPDRVLGQIRLYNGVGDHVRAHMFGLGPHLIHEPRALDHVGETGIVLDIGGDGHLTARLDALDQERLQHGARRVDGGGVAGRTGADDDHLFVAGTHKTCLSFKLGLRQVRRQACGRNPSGFTSHLSRRLSTGPAFGSRPSALRIWEATASVSFTGA